MPGRLELTVLLHSFALTCTRTFHCISVHIDWLPQCPTHTWVDSADQLLPGRFIHTEVIALYCRHSSRFEDIYRWDGHRLQRVACHPMRTDFKPNFPGCLAHFTGWASNLQASNSKFVCRHANYQGLFKSPLQRGNWNIVKPTLCNHGIYAVGEILKAALIVVQ